MYFIRLLLGGLSPGDERQRRNRQLPASFFWALVETSGLEPPDPLLAKQVLYQLSYVPLFTCGNTLQTGCTAKIQQMTSSRTQAENGAHRRDITKVSEQVIATSVGDLEVALVEFEWSLNAANRSPRTVETYGEATPARLRAGSETLDELLDEVSLVAVGSSGSRVHPRVLHGDSGLLR